MSLSNYANLKTEIISWGHRGESMAPKMDTLINLVETEMYANQVEVLELRGAETLVAFSTSITTRFAALPAGYKSFRKVRIQIANGESVQLKYSTPSRLNILSSAGLPLFYTVTSQVEFERISDQVYTGEYQYYQDFTPLSSSNASNFVLTRFPTIYLFGCMWAYMLHVEQFDKAGVYYTQFISAIRGANEVDKRGRYGPVPVMRVEGTAP